MKRIPKHIKFPADLVAQIEQYQKDNYISSFAGAVYELIRRGLKVSDNRGDWRHPLSEANSSPTFASLRGGGFLDKNDKIQQTGTYPV